jgi:hypothetical protein
MNQLLINSIVATEVLLKKHCVITQWPEVILGLKEATGQDLEEIASQKLTPENIIDILVKSEFISNSPKANDVIVIDENIIPEDTFQSLYEETIKSKGNIWVIHKSDADPFPSNPHAHNKETGLKLNLGSGDLYNGKRHCGKVSMKNLNIIRNKMKNITPPPLEE